MDINAMWIVMKLSPKDFSAVASRLAQRGGIFLREGLVLVGEWRVLHF